MLGLSSMHSPAPSSFSLANVVQCVFLAGVAYFLAGAPFSTTSSSSLSFFSSTSSASQRPGAAIDASKLESLVIPEPELSCAEHGYKGVYVLSREPLVVYIEGFLGESEAEEVVQASTPHFTPSTVWTQGKEHLDPAVRSSEKAALPRDHTVQCIEERARRFQGWRPNLFVEKLWAQRYGPGGHYTYHYDWSTASRTSGRVSSFMVYLAANCTGGGTHFPRLARPASAEWCQFIECEPAVLEAAGDETPPPGSGQARLTDGVIFKPLAGNAIYWENLRLDGSGFAESWHAGLPVKNGVKIGLNIWSWFQAD